MAATAQVFDMNDTDSENSVIAYHVLGLLRKDHRAWYTLIKENAEGETLIPRSRSPHLHPPNPKLPCMFCAAMSHDISSVSAAVLLSLAEMRFRDDAWNAEEGRRSDMVVSAAKTLTEVSEERMEELFGPNWNMVIALGYKIEHASPKELSEIVELSRRLGREYPTSSSTKGRDWTHSARWLVSRSISSRRHATDTANRLRHQDTVEALAGIANYVSRFGNPLDGAAPWLTCPADSDPINTNVPELKVIR